MKNWICVAALMIAGTQTFAADGRLSPTDLDSFGLSGIQIISDAEGVDVRGTSSWANVEGKSRSSIGGGWFHSTGTSATNEYKAKAENQNDSTAEGRSESFSREETVISGNINYQGHTDVIVTGEVTTTYTIGSGGAAFASAN